MITLAWLNTAKKPLHKIWELIFFFPYYNLYTVQPAQDETIKNSLYCSKFHCVIDIIIWILHQKANNTITLFVLDIKPYHLLTVVYPSFITTCNIWIY